MEKGSCFFFSRGMIQPYLIFMILSVKANIFSQVFAFQLQLIVRRS